MPAVLILSTAASREEAETIAGTLVAERLAACVQLEAIDSWYRWQDAVERAAEIRLQIKTEAAQVDAVAQRLRALHSYDIPEFVVLPIADGMPDYLAWIERQVRSP